MNNPSHNAQRDLYQDATDRIIKALEAGTTPWQKPWDNIETGPLRNGASGNAYHGINTILLCSSSLERGFTDPRWLTFKQCKQAGYTIKKGAKAERVYFFKPVEVDERDGTGVPVIDAATGQTRKKQIPFLQTSPVFNAQEIEGIPALAPNEKPFAPIAAGEQILQRCPVPIQYGGNSAHYNHVADTIGMPEKTQFKSPEAFYATLAHEIVHATGHESRCNREFGQRFGDRAYGMEELVAEMGSVQIAMETGLPSQIDNHAAYVDHWLNLLKTDKKALFVAAAKASQAVDFVMGRPTLSAQTRQTFSPKEAARQVVSDVVKSAPLTPPILTGVDVAKLPPALDVLAKLKARRAKQQGNEASPDISPSKLGNPKM